MKNNRLFDLTVLGVCVFLALVTMVLNWMSPVARAIQRNQRINLLIIGSDYEDYTRHSDTLMYASYDPQSRFLDVLSIPRDTIVTVPELPHVHRINEIFAYQFHHTNKNFDLSSLYLKDFVQTMLSTGTVTAVQIPYYVTIDYKGFRTLIDAMGGIYIRVIEPMNYDDNWGNLHIHFDKGTYLLDGKKALEYVRFRGGSADQGRVRRQQLFVKEMIKRLKNPSVLWRFPAYSRAILSSFHTNLTFWDCVNLFLEGRRLNWSNLRLISLPGTATGNLWHMNAESTAHVMEMIQQPGPVGGRTALSVMDSKPLAAWRGHATVEVWNATDQPNAAMAVARFLRQNGFDVVHYGNFAGRQPQTLVIDRSGDLRPAQAVAQVMSAISPDVVSRPERTLQVDVWVIVGNDYKQLDSRWK